MEPRLDDLHEGLLVEVAEEEGSDELHQRLVEQEVSELEAVRGEEGVDVGLDALVGVALDQAGAVVDDLGQQVDQFLLVLLEDEGESHEDAEVFLVGQHRFLYLPLLLLAQVAIAVDRLDLPALPALRELLVVGGQNSRAHLQASLLQHLLHAGQVVVD